ncbi:hypothetical protein KIPB_005697 [Kipferlia bialata]|uniref:Uncharacterized protein n=1 Tax=Kipferlia bialata TaxID=797122 RepID=A0A9K3CWE7_9EUKA|nr:hypothetical protein KIPB_005697 [Kipferlia bialata]|eukprot:g5697.t1
MPEIAGSLGAHLYNSRPAESAQMGETRKKELAREKFLKLRSEVAVVLASGEATSAASLSELVAGDFVAYVSERAAVSRQLLDDDRHVPLYKAILRTFHKLRALKKLPSLSGDMDLQVQVEMEEEKLDLAHANVATRQKWRFERFRQLRDEYLSKSLPVTSRRMLRRHYSVHVPLIYLLVRVSALKLMEEAMPKWSQCPVARSAELRAFNLLQSVVDQHGAMTSLSFASPYIPSRYRSGLASHRSGYNSVRFSRMRPPKLQMAGTLSSSVQLLVNGSSDEPGSCADDLRRKFAGWLRDVNSLESIDPNGEQETYSGAPSPAQKLEKAIAGSHWERNAASSGMVDSTPEPDRERERERERANSYMQTPMFNGSASVTGSRRGSARSTPGSSARRRSLLPKVAASFQVRRYSNLPKNQGEEEGGVLTSGGIVLPPLSLSLAGSGSVKSTHRERLSKRDQGWNTPGVDGMLTIPEMAE